MKLKNFELLSGKETQNICSFQECKPNKEDKPFLIFLFLLILRNFELSSALHFHEIFVEPRKTLK